MKKKKNSHKTSLLLLLCLALFLLYFFKQKQPFAKKEPVSQNNAFSHSSHLKSSKTMMQNYTIKNSITPTMLTYTHWSGSYTPSIFAISIQGTYLQPGETLSISANSENPIKIRYDYSFMNGYRTGSREIAFAPLQGTENLNLTFSWHEPAHLILENTKMVGETVLPFNTTLEKNHTNNTAKNPFKK